MKMDKMALWALVLMVVAMVLGGCTIYQYTDSYRRHGKPYMQDGVRIKHIGPITVVQVHGYRGTARAAEWRMRNSGTYYRPSKRFPMPYTAHLAPPVATVEE